MSRCQGKGKCRIAGYTVFRDDGTVFPMMRAPGARPEDWHYACKDCDWMSRLPRPGEMSRHDLDRKIADLQKWARSKGII